MSTIDMIESSALILLVMYCGHDQDVHTRLHYDSAQVSEHLILVAHSRSPQHAQHSSAMVHDVACSFEDHSDSSFELEPKWQWMYAHL